MMKAQIHATAIIDSSCELEPGVSVGPYAVLEGGVRVGEGSSIASHAVLKKATIIGRKAQVGHFAVLGGDPQHLGFDPDTPSELIIGDEVRLGEGVTVHRSMYENGKTIIENGCFLMGNAHVAHDCRIAENTILANGALLGGHVVLGADVFVGGGAGLHQFIRVGEGAMIGGLAQVSADVPPQVTVSERNRACGLNLVGLKRRQATKQEQRELKEAYRRVFMKTGNPTKLAELILSGDSPPQSPIVRSFLEFFLSGSRGFVRSLHSQ